MGDEASGGYNRAMSRNIEAHPNKFIGIADLSLQDTPRTIVAAEFAVRELGLDCR